MKTWSVLASVMVAMVAGGAVFGQDGAKVRSKLYPVDWKAGVADAEGRLLHDFSYAGYRYGEALPRVAGPVVVVEGADASGERDSTGVIQAALDKAGAHGGGVVVLPEGVFRISYQAGKNFALRIGESKVVLRGAGMGKTRLFCDEAVSRGKNVIVLGPEKGVEWVNPKDAGVRVTADLPWPVREIPVEKAGGFKVGDLIVVKTSVTEGWVEEVGMVGKWKPDQPQMRGQSLLRRITAVGETSITVDVPTRVGMKMRDELRVVKLEDGLVTESGVEELSIGQRENPTNGGSGVGWGGLDWNKEGTGAYQVHGGAAVQVNSCENVWVRKVGTYLPEGNKQYHIHSYGVRIGASRLVTVEGCDLRLPQYRGEGGNGYLYTLSGNDCLVRDCLAVSGRHNYDMQGMACSGNVVLRCVTRTPSLASDYHMWFSTANLMDSMTVEGDLLEAVYRPYGGSTVHGLTASECVFWNTKGVRGLGDRKFVVQSKQYRVGYVIGTSGAVSGVAPDSTGWVEAVGDGERLEPQSLYEDQRVRRLKR